MQEYTKFNSVLKATQCGEIVNVYEKNIGRGTMPFFDLMSNNGKSYKFAYASTGGMSLWYRSLFDEKAKDKLKLIKNLRVGDTLCVTYSLKYQEGSILHARPDTPYIFTIELSNVTK